MALLHKKSEDQEVGSKDGVVDAWYEGIFKDGKLGGGMLGISLFLSNFFSS